MLQRDGLPNQGEQSMPRHNKEPEKRALRILVTGGAGYIGSHAVRLFLSRGHDVWVYDNLSLGHRGAVPRDRLLVADLAEVHRLALALLRPGIEPRLYLGAVRGSRGRAAETTVTEPTRPPDPLA